MEFAIIFIFVIFTMIFLKYQKNLMPEKYFYFGRLLDGFDEDISFLGVMFRLFIPFCFSFFIAIVATVFKFNISPVICSIIVGFMSAFLLVWPDFYNPELISQKYQTQKKKLYTLYIMVIIMFSIIGYVGSQISILFLKSLILFNFVATNFFEYLNTTPKEFFIDLIKAIITSLISIGLINIFLFIIHKMKSST